MASSTIDSAGLDAHRNVDRAERAHDRRAEARRADQRRDDHHRQAQHDALRDAGHDRRQRIGQFDLPQQLALRRAERLAASLQRQRHRDDAEIGQPDRRGDARRSRSRSGPGAAPRWNSTSVGIR